MTLTHLRLPPSDDLFHSLQNKSTGLFLYDLNLWPQWCWGVNSPFSKSQKYLSFWNVYYLYIPEPRSLIFQELHKVNFSIMGNKRADWKDFTPECSHSARAWVIMAAASLCIIKGTGVCHLHQTLASPREPPEKASVVTVETSSFLDSDSWRLRQPGPKRGLV